MTKHHHSAHTVCPCAMQPLTNDLVFVSICVRVCVSKCLCKCRHIREKEKAREEWREGQKETAVSIPFLIFK